MTYDQATRAIWRRSEGGPQDEHATIREIVRHATLAPSGHNTQSWRFRIKARSITVLPDTSRRTPVVDPDDHHLYVSLGCAVENLLIAASAFGFAGVPRFDDHGDGSITVELEPSSTRRSALFDAITERQCTRSEYDGAKVGTDVLRRLQAAGNGGGVEVTILTERDAIEEVVEFVVDGNSKQLGDPEFVRELRSWVRFNDADAIRSGDGLSSRVTGNPQIPRALGRIVFPLVARAKTLNDSYAQQIRSSAGIAVFTSRVDDRAYWTECGQCYQRFALTATTHGIRNAFVNQPVEVAGLRQAFARAVGAGNGRPDLVVRFGSAAPMARSLRRPLDAVLTNE